MAEHILSQKFEVIQKYETACHTESVAIERLKRWQKEFNGEIE